MKKTTIIFLTLAMLTFGLIAMTSCSQKVASSKDVTNMRPEITIPDYTDLPEDMAEIKKAKNGWWKKSMNNWDERTSWFHDDRFGCFVHWGVYSLPGGYWKGEAVHGYAEHLMRIKKIPLQEYTEDIVKKFNPVKFDADEWMKMVKDAGMKYFVITAKHHDGFAMYPSKVYPYNITMTKFRRDPMMELRNAAKKYGIKFGFYYSHAFDWEHSDAPGNDWMWNHPGGDRHLGGGDWWNDSTYKSFLPQADKYVKEKAIPQIQELIRTYHPDILWFDTPHKLPLYQNIRILEAVREVDPEGNVVVNGRLAHYGDVNMGDYEDTSDRAAYFHSVKGLWEAIPTTNNSYGYNASDTIRKPASHFIRLLESSVSRGGNILMNIGPMGNGAICQADADILAGIGKWMKVNSSSIYGCGNAHMPMQQWGVFTQKADTLYAHIQYWPSDNKVVLGGLRSTVGKAWMIGQPDRKVSLDKLNDNDQLLNLDGNCPDSISTVIAMIVKDYVPADTAIYLSSRDSSELYSFDAKLIGKSLSYGSGKIQQNYVQGWHSNDEALQWDVRLSESADYDVYLDYCTHDERWNGTLQLNIVGEGDNDDARVQPLSINYDGYYWKRGIKEINAGTLNLKKGRYQFTLNGVQHKGESFPRVVGLRFVPKK